MESGQWTESGEKGQEGWRGAAEWQKAAHAKASKRNVCVCVSCPMCLSKQGKTGLPYQRSTVEYLLPRLTVGLHSHLSPCTDPLVSS